MENVMNKEKNILSIKNNYELINKEGYFIYDLKTSTIYRFNGKYFAEYNRYELLNMIYKINGAEIQPHYTNAIIEFLKSNWAVTQAEMNQSYDKLNFKNGTYNIITKTLEPHSHNDK